MFALCLSDPSVFELCLMKPSVFYYLIVGQFRWHWQGGRSNMISLLLTRPHLHTLLLYFTSSVTSIFFGLYANSSRLVGKLGHSGAKGCSFYFCQNPNKMATMVTIRKLGSGLVGLIKITGSPPRRAGFPFLSRHLACWVHRPPPGELP